METWKENALCGFSSIVHTLNKSTVFHQGGANELIGQLNYLLMNNIEYLKKSDHLKEEDKQSIIEESVYVILDAINCISALSEIHGYYTEFEKQNKRNKRHD